MDAEAQKWIEGKAKLWPLEPDNAVSCATHDRFFNYIENAKRCAQAIRAMRGNAE